MPIASLLKYMDQYKVKGGFKFPSKHNFNKKLDKRDYTIFFGSIPGFILTLIVASIASAYFFSMSFKMIKGDLDQWKQETVPNDNE